MKKIPLFMLLLSLLFSFGAQAQTDPVEELLAQMSLEEKIGQMTLVEKNSIFPADIATYSIGGLLSGGGGYPRNNNTPEGWREMVENFQSQAAQSRLGIPLIYGVDAVHGHGNLYGATIFPHNIGLGASRNPELVQEVCRLTAREMMATGIFWNYAPVLAVPQDIRWGRTYEAFAEDTELVTELGVACLLGLQGQTLTSDSVLGTPKHFIGDGGTVWGSATTNNYQIDQGVMEADEATLRAIHLPPYQAAIEANAMSIMISFSSWNETKMHAEAYLINEVLKGELGFEGFVVSDWGGIDQINPSDYYDSVVQSINAGVDMNMVPYDYKRFIDVMLTAVEKGDIPLERIDDAVRRILAVKFQLGLFERQAEFTDSVGSDEHRALARQAVSESLVLLQNEDATLPLEKTISTLLLAGSGANDIGMQAGGWTMEWQGKTGKITLGTSILEALQQTLGEDTTIHYDSLGRFRALGENERAEVGIVVVGEKPYAEGLGDSDNLVLSEADLTVIRRVSERSDRVVVILLSGRPIEVSEAMEYSDAFVAAWLPGTEALGITDVLFGDLPFTGKLPFSWHDPVLPFGYGLE